MKTQSGKGLRIMVQGGAWTTNIGNAFIHYGALALIKAAVPSARVTLTSWMPRWFFRASDAHSRRWLRKFPLNLIAQKSTPLMDNAIDMTSVIDCDYLVIAGMVLYSELEAVCGPALRHAVRAGTKVIFLGAGALKYSEEERRIVHRLLEEIRPVGFSSRDDETFTLYANVAPRMVRGVDCGFSVPATYAPFGLRLPPFIVSNFDSNQEPTIDPQGRLLVRTHHQSWGLLPVAQCANENTLVSDLPEDYLSLYANAEEVHSDRVHACVAALAYGRKARFYGNTPRASLFKPLGLEAVSRELVMLDADLLREKNAAQVEFLRDCFETN